ncbi:Beta-lactamase family protein [Sphingomonas antarctica]|uniref:serine hydrolase domain-containing protein n=1 Tax=Sphingomonas antarctica TaxID=2040274 RepID=UPI0039E75A55
MLLARAAALGLTLLAFPAAAQDVVPLQTFLERTLAATQEKDKLPAAAALVHIDGKIVAEAAIGVRAIGHSQPVTKRDRWHLGSDTKAFTSTMIARLVEKGVMRFEDTLAESLPAYAPQMNPAYRSVTVTQLLNHTAGLPTLTDDKDLPVILALIQGEKDISAQRMRVTQKYLAEPPASKIGEYEYSNLGYMIAGAIAEKHTGKSWEDLIRAEIFRPLGIRNAGFGNPAKPGQVGQPWGHTEVAGALVALDPANPTSDNPAVIGPAGTINISLRDWMLFAQDHLDGVNGRGKLLKTATYRILHTPVTERYSYGWGVKLGPDGSPLLLTHAGSNGFWVADIRIMPKHNIITLVVSNAGNEAANQAIVHIGKPLKDRLKPFE